MNIGQLEGMTLSDLRDLSKEYDVSGASRMKKEDLILRIMQSDAERRGLELRGGVLEIMNEGMGFLRADHYLPGRNDIYVSQSQMRRFKLRTGDMIIGQIRPPKDTEKYFGLLRVNRSMEWTRKTRKTGPGSMTLRQSSRRNGLISRRTASRSPRA